MDNVGDFKQRNTMHAYTTKQGRPLFVSFTFNTNTLQFVGGLGAHAQPPNTHRIQASRHHMYSAK